MGKVVRKFWGVTYKYNETPLPPPPPVRCDIFATYPPPIRMLQYNTCCRNATLLQNRHMPFYLRMILNNRGAICSNGNNARHRSAILTHLILLHYYVNIAYLSSRAHHARAYVRGRVPIPITQTTRTNQEHSVFVG